MDIFCSVLASKFQDRREGWGGWVGNYPRARKGPVKISVYGYIKLIYSHQYRGIET